MVDKFLGTSNGGDIADGTVTIFGSTIGASNLDPSKALKTNAVNQLVSSNLDISDVNNLQTELDNALTNPFVGTLEATDFKTDTFTSVNAEFTSLNDTTQNQSADASHTAFTGDIRANTLTNTAQTAAIRFDPQEILLDADTTITRDIRPGSTGLHDLGTEALAYGAVYSGFDMGPTNSTGWLGGGELTAALGGTTIQIAAGIGQINTQAHRKIVTWNAHNISILSAPDILTCCAIDETGSLITSNAPFSPQQSRNMILIGEVSHAGAVVDFSVRNSFVLETTNANLTDLINGLGIFNLSGNVFFANAGANLSIDSFKLLFIVLVSTSSTLSLLATRTISSTDWMRMFTSYCES